MTWPWCIEVPYVDREIPPDWLPYFHDPGLLARSGRSATLGVFRLLRAALVHRHQAAGLALDEPDPGRVLSLDHARELLARYTEMLRGLLAAGVYLGPDGTPVTGPPSPASWPSSVPDFVSWFPRLRYVRRPLLEVEEEVPIASSVRFGSVIGTWAVPRFSPCRRVRSVQVEESSGNVHVQPGAHGSPFGPVAAVYPHRSEFMTPVDPPKKVSDAHAGPGAFQFDLAEMSAEPPDGYGGGDGGGPYGYGYGYGYGPGGAPPPNCEYRYLLHGSWQRAELDLNGRRFWLDGPGPVDVTEAVQTQNTAVVTGWRGEPAWGELHLREVWQWPGADPAPETAVHRYREFVRFGALPLGNRGGTECVRFRLTGVVEAFSSGPFAGPEPQSWPPPRADVWPRHLDPGMLARVNFLAPSMGQFEYAVTLRDNLPGAPERPLGGGTVAQEVTEHPFRAPADLAPTALLRVDGGGDFPLYATVLGPRPRPFCEYHWYGSEQPHPGIYVNGGSGLVVWPRPDAPWIAPGGAFTLFLRVRVADGGLAATGTHLAAVSGGTVSFGTLSHPGLQEGRLADVVLQGSGSEIRLTVDGVPAGAAPSAAVFGPDLAIGRLFGGSLHRAVLVAGVLDPAAVAALSAGYVPPSPVFDLDLATGSGTWIPDCGGAGNHADAGDGTAHVFPASYGTLTVVRFPVSLAEPVLLAVLPPGTAPVRVEFEVLSELPPGIVLRVGTPAAPASVLQVAGVRIPGFHAYAVSHPSVAVPTALYLQTQGGPPPSSLRVRLVYEIRG